MHPVLYSFAKCLVLLSDCPPAFVTVDLAAYVRRKLIYSINTAEILPGQDLLPIHARPLPRIIVVQTSPLCGVRGPHASSE